MRIVSWNVNGIRAVYKRGDLGWLFESSAKGGKGGADIICLQEVKASVDQLPPEVASPAGYHAFFDWPKAKKGYSGVAMYSKEKPKEVFFGEDTPLQDQEGRLVGAIFEDFVLLNIYFPNGGGGPERLKYKLVFYDKFLAFVKQLEKKHGKVIFCGDVNTAHKEIDLARPKENETHTGFLPEERAWIDRVVRSGFTDVYRNFFPDKKDAYTYWDQKTFARLRNVGWRIDYFFANKKAAVDIEKMTIHSDIFGSDHCPISIDTK